MEDEMTPRDKGKQQVVTMWEAVTTAIPTGAGQTISWPGGAGAANNRTQPSSLDQFPTEELIMEMISRGFAVMKLDDIAGKL